MTYCAHIRPTSDHRCSTRHTGMRRGAPAPRDLVPRDLVGRDLVAGFILAGATLLLALGGCGYQAHEGLDHPPSSVIIDGGPAVPDMAAAATGAPPSAGAILFVASPGDGGTPRLIARTDSITSAPTAEFLAREALAAQRGTSQSSTRVAAPIAPGTGEDPATPLTLPVATGTTANSRIAISRQTGVDDGPTILRIIEAP